MEKKRYSSYAQIELELEIIKVEKELNLKRIVLNIEKTKESLLPKNLLLSFLGDYKKILSDYSGTILNIAVPLIISWITKRKRGN